MGIREKYMQRCLELAEQGLGYTASNPLVGAVLEYQGRIIGEGFHRQYGKEHAEVACIQSVAPEDRPLIPDATLYVSLEPCAHYGKTPPCTNLIIEHRIQQVVIACRDPFPAVNGKGIGQLKNAGINVIEQVLEKEAWDLNRRFFTFHQQCRPYILLKWARTANNKIAGENGQRIKISHPLTDRMVHKWRSEETAILIGSQTAQNDNPLLNNRYWPGPSPMKLLIDRSLKLPDTLELFKTGSTLIFNELRNDQEGNKEYIQLSEGEELLSGILKTLYERKICSMMVEGGTILLNAFLKAGLWDEARVITNEKMILETGREGPNLPNTKPFREMTIGQDRINWYRNGNAEKAAHE
jgi:diaminohydroxyphosphoribosylaminopyrimidine deaminase/5-amino-6-(5-phosphoribosylamino)uracil reductase